MKTNQIVRIDKKISGSFADQQERSAAEYDELDGAGFVLGNGLLSHCGVTTKNTKFGYGMKTKSENVLMGVSIDLASKARTCAHKCPCRQPTCACARNQATRFGQPK